MGEADYIKGAEIPRLTVFETRFLFSIQVELFEEPVTDSNERTSTYLVLSSLFTNQITFFFRSQNLSVGRM